MDETLDTVLVCDSNHFLSTRLLSTATAKQDTEKNESLMPDSVYSPSAKKCSSVLNLKSIAPTSKSNLPNAITPSPIKRKSKILKMKDGVIAEFREHEPPAVDDCR